MIQLGQYQVLTIQRKTEDGVFLSDDAGNEVWMDAAEVTEEMIIGAEWEVFVYTDSDDRVIATTCTPALTAGQFAYLRVNDVNQTGAFCEWGIPKELFIPFRNQKEKLRKGQHAIVHMFLDQVSHRLVGTTRLSSFLQKEADERPQMKEEVDLLVYRETDLGYQVIINHCYLGLVYENEIHQLLRIGQQLKGYVKLIREDRKIDISLYPIGHESIEPQAQLILQQLQQADGFLPFTDKSDPHAIREQFGISKKLFKKSLGALYRQRLVQLKADGIYLAKKS